MFFLNDVYLVVPEIYLIFSVLTLIWLSVVYVIELVSSGKLLGIQLSVVVIGIISLSCVLYGNIYQVECFIIGTTFYVSKFSKIFLFLVLFGINIVSCLAISYIKVNSLNSTELVIMFLFILLGFIVLIFSNDFLSMYMGIELQSLGLYVLATLKQNSIYATEAGLKYFILGAVASCLLILGISIIYSFTGLNTFTDIMLFLQNTSLEVSILGVIVGFLLVFSSLLFKIGGAPFHIWLPDVYEGVAMIVTNFFALVPKVVIFNILIKLFFIVGDLFVIEFQYLILFSSILSISIGAIGAIFQTTIKRMLSYSAIGHTGFILLGLSVLNTEGLISMLFYLGVYFGLILTIFAILLQLQQKETGVTVKYINNLSYVYKNNNVLGGSLLLIFFGVAGIPPLSGFFSKLYVFLAAINQEYFFVAGIVIVFSVLSCVYYLRVIRNVIFVKDKKKNYLLNSVSIIGSYIISWSLSWNILFMVIGNSFIYLCYNSSLNYIY